MEKKDITASDIKKLMLRSFRRFSTGETNESTAYKEISMLGNILKAYEVTETEERLKAIEETLSTNKNIYNNDDDE